MTVSVDFVYSIAYCLFGLCLVAPPTEIVSAGLTVQNVLSRYLGSEDMNFVYYHIRRTTATVIVHSLLPLGYYVGLVLFSEQGILDFTNPLLLSFHWKWYLAGSLTLPLLMVGVAFYWSRHNWKRHPIAKNLQTLAQQNSSWHAVASSINVEFRRIDKFVTGSPGRMTYVTDSWVLKTTSYFLYVAHQEDIRLNLVATDTHDISHESETGVQYLSLDVISANNHHKSFTIRLNATEYQDLQLKLQSPVRNARNVVIQQSLSDRFLQAFSEQVQQNVPFQKSEGTELEPCIGCMQTTANVKLQKNCDELQRGDCMQCYCRPMWCLECMGKWFVNRQNKERPETWMSCRAPCPTCRSIFCMADVCRIV